MSVKSTEVEEDVLAQLEEARRLKEKADQHLAELEKRSTAEITKKINVLIKSVSLEPMSLYDACIASMSINSDVALQMAARLILKAGLPDAQSLAILKSHLALRSVSSESAKEKGEKGSRTMFFLYMLDPGEKDAIDGGLMTEGVHRHDPAYWCPRRESGKNPEWYNEENRWAEFKRTADESAIYKNYKQKVAQAKKKEEQAKKKEDQS